MLKIGSRGTIAGLVLTGLAAAWVVYDSRDGESSSNPEINRQSAEKSSRTVRQERKLSSLTDIEQRPANKVENADSELTDTVSPYRQPASDLSVVNDRTLLRKPVKSVHTIQLNERQKLKAQRAGITISGDTLGLDEALAAQSDATADRVTTVRA